MFHQSVLSLVLQLSLLSLAVAQPISTNSNSWQYGTGGGIIGFIILILDIIVFGMSCFLFPSINPFVDT